MVQEVQFLPVVQGLPEVLVVQHFRLVLVVLAALVHHLAQMDRRVRLLLGNLVIPEVPEVLENKTVFPSNFTDTFMMRDILNMYVQISYWDKTKQNVSFEHK